jgi:ribonuclease E
MNHETEVGAATASEPVAPSGASGDEGPTPARPTGARRRRRGGRGRGRGGAAKPTGGVGAPPREEDGEASAPAAATTARASGASSGSTPRQRRAPASGSSRARVAATDGSASERGAVDGEGSSAPAAATADPGVDTGASTTAARRRRSRGGRGRGGRKPSTAAAVGADDEAPIDATPATQREDAQPDAPAVGEGSASGGSGRRRRRGRRGSGATKRTTAPDGAVGSDGAAAGEPAAKPRSVKGTAPKAEPATRRRGERSVEERVAAGGPTRGIRSSRSRTGRVGGRRRREETIVAPRIRDKVMVITEHGDRDQIAVLEEDQLVQHYVTRTGAHSMVGNIYLGRVQNVLPGMEAAFVDVGRGRNGVLYAGEVNYSPEDLEGAAPRIEHILKNGQSVMVQVTKDPMGGKGARLTAQISLPGRFLVFAPDQALSGISRRVPDTERRRLKAILRKIKPDQHGIIVRTAAEGASEEALTADLERLVRAWDDIVKRSKKAKAPAVLYEEPELTVRVVRDLFTDGEFKVLATDCVRVHGKVMEYVADIAPDIADKVQLHTGKLPVFEEYRVVEQIHKALDRKVWLPSGGYLIIERTEAMTIVDVNTGKSVGKTNLEETVVNTNLEAARETARQLRLRDIGGIIVVDFIDMLLEQNKQQVEETMKEALAIDKTRSQVFEIGPLGLMQVTRKRVSSGLVESFSETCPTCEGRGILINYEA